MQVAVRSHATAAAWASPRTVFCPAGGLFLVGGLAGAAEGGSHGVWDEPAEALCGALEHDLASLAVARKRHVLDGKMVVAVPVPGPYGSVAPRGCGHDREGLESRPLG